MAPSTRATKRPHTPDRSQYQGDCTTQRRTEFFTRYDEATPSKTMGSICDRSNITTRTGRNWLKQRREIGSPAYHRSRPRSEVLGRKSRITKAQCELLVSPSRNPHRNQRYEAQLHYFNIDLEPRALRVQLAKHTKNGYRHKQAFAKWEFNESNIQGRTAHANQWEHATVENEFQYWVFTDEAHFDGFAQQAGFILREEGPGERLRPENIDMRPAKGKVQFHAAGWCNWWAIAPELIWYHEQEEHTEQPKPKRPQRPRKSMYESVEEHSKRVADWEAEWPQPVKIKPQGNAMTGKTYHDQILPHYITAIKNLECRARGRGDYNKFKLQEDNDRSHGHSKDNHTIQDRTKASHGIETIEHPAKSPDVNPQECVWNILKNKAKKEIWHTREEYKALLNRIYSEITLEEVRKRILELPDRIAQLKQHPDKIIKSDMW